MPESVCPKCNPMQPPPSMAKAASGSSAIEPGTKIRFKSEKIETATGIETVKAREAVVGEGIEATARIELDRNNMADIRAPIPGVVERVLVDLGQHVKKGERLFALESPEVGDLQGALSSSRQRVEAARRDFERAKKLNEEGIAPERRLETARRDLEVAQADQRAAESALRISGASSGSSSGQYVLRAPLAGSVVRRSATVGTYATEETSLATVADTSTMWAMLDVGEADAAPIREGHEATVTVDGLEGHTFTGEVTWVASEVDPKTRTVRVRVEVDNDEGLLRAHQFGRAIVEVDAGGAAVAVPRESIQRMGEESVVFVRVEPGLYEPKVVRLGRSQEDLVQVWGPVESGDAVVTGGAFLLKTELARDSIGAGCCEVEPPSG
ncbi:MAG: efflux RND transporter periplasmic adaptor subunit [Polyangiales bacterium]